MGETPSVGFEALISHRFRGFAPLENTLPGLRAALDFGVLNLEFDVRVDACGKPMIYHDEFAPDKDGKNRHLCDYPASQFDRLGGRFTAIPSFEALLSTIDHHKNKQARFLVDIKDQGFEEAIHALIMFYRLEHRVIYVSWLPEVLYRLHEIAPHIPLCLSHWCGPISAQVAARHKIYISEDGTIPRDSTPYITGVRSGWALKKPLTGDLLTAINRSGGGICVPEMLLTRELSAYYHQHKLWVSTFSYTNWADINRHRSELNVDLFFVDNKRVFEALS